MVDDARDPLNILKDSAVVITGLSVLLFVWGFSFEAFAALYLGVPLDFASERSLQEYLLTGGFVALFFYAPAVLVVLVIARAARAFLRTRHVGMKPFKWPKAIPLAIYLLVVSIGALVPLSRYIVRSAPKERVMRLTPIAGVVFQTDYAGWYLVAVADQSLVLIDRPTQKGAFIRVLKRDEVLEIQLIHDESWRTKLLQPPLPKNPVDPAHFKPAA
jgi:hypothetical protein